MKHMIALLGFSAVLAIGHGSISSILPGTTYIRTPAYDSAVIQSDRFGGNFAYSTVEGQAYQSITPVISNVVHPLVNYHYNTLPLASYPATSLFVQQPILSTYPSFAISEQDHLSVAAGPNEEQRDQEESVTIDAAN